MYQNNPYMPNMQSEMYGTPKPDYMTNSGCTPDYMMMSMPMEMPMGMPTAMPMGMPMAMPMCMPTAMPMGMPMDCAQPMYIKEKKCVKIPEIIGKNKCSLLIQQEIPFAPGCPAMAIKDIQIEVKCIELCVCKDKVLINGELHKNINYKTLSNMITHNKFTCDCKCMDIAYGDLKHVHVCIPFTTFIDVPGARKGDIVEVDFAGVEEGCDLDTLCDPCYVKGYSMPVYQKVSEKVIVKIVVKVLRPCQMTIDPETPCICP